MKNSHLKIGYEISLKYPNISIDITIRVLTLLLVFSEKLFRFSKIYSNFNKKALEIECF